MLKMPGQLGIGPYVYSVVHDADGMDKTQWGEHIPRERRIRIAPGLSTQVEREAVLHEVVHACWDIAGLGFSRAAPHEEHVVTAVSTQLIDALRRNPALVRYLTEKGTP